MKETFFEQAGGVAVKSVTDEFGVERRTFQFQVESNLGRLRALLFGLACISIAARPKSSSNRM